jgi:hypothetical protein
MTSPRQGFKQLDIKEPFTSPNQNTWKLCVYVHDESKVDHDRTAEIAANAPRYRRRSSTFIDGIHDITEGQDLAPAQLYSTMSGRLFHSGRIAIAMVGPPARGKT